MVGAVGIAVVREVRARRVRKVSRKEDMFIVDKLFPERESGRSCGDEGDGELIECKRQKSWNTNGDGDGDGDERRMHTSAYVKRVRLHARAGDGSVCTTLSAFVLAL